MFTLHRWRVGVQVPPMGPNIEGFKYQKESLFGYLDSSEGVPLQTPETLQSPYACAPCPKP